MNKDKLRWIIENPNDTIQRHLVRNEFFEIEELEFLKSVIGVDNVVADIGANIGNHSVYFSKFTTAKEIYVIEPIPKTYKMLLANLALNYCHNVNTDFIGVGLGNRECVGYPFMQYGVDNLGATALSPTPVNNLDESVLFDAVPVVTGDSLFENIHIDLCKIDTEGMELIVLEGLAKTIENCRPRMYIEIMDINKAEFSKWLIDNKYKVSKVFDRYSKGLFANYYILPG